MKAGEVQPFFYDDLSLFRGRTGVAFVLLQLLKLDRCKAGVQQTGVPAEFIANGSTGGNTLPESREVLQRLLQRTFPRTLRSLPRAPSISIPSVGVSLFEHMVESMGRQGMDSSGLLQYEKHRFKAYNKLMRLEKMGDEARQSATVADAPPGDRRLLSMKLELSPHISIHEINDRVSLRSANEASYIVLKAQFLRLEEIEMDEEAVSFLRFFKPGQRVSRAIQQFMTSRAEGADHGAYLDFIREVLQLQLLIPAKTLTK
jgi:hypothetical protein